MKRKKILFVVNRFYPEIGGAELNTYKQSQELSREYDVTVFCPERTEESLGYIDPKMRIVRLFNMFNIKRRFPFQGAQTLCLGVFFRILFGNYDAVFCYPAPSYNSYLALIAGKMRSIPCILVSYDLHDYAKLLGEGVQIGKDISKIGSFSRLRKFFVKRFNHIFAISNREINFYKKFNKSVSYSPVAIDFSDYPNEPLKEKSSKEFKIVMIGRVSRIKGQDVGLEGVKKLREMNVNAKLQIIGRTDFEPSFVNKLKKRIVELGLENHVEILGAISRGSLLEKLSEAHVHLIPVRFMNSGAVVVESLASGTFVVQSDMVDPSVVKEGEDGYTFESENILDLSRKLFLSYELLSSRKDKMAEARQRVLKEFNYEVLGDILKRKIQSAS